MFRKAVFVIRENILQEKILSEDSILVDSLREHGIMVVCMTWDRQDLEWMRGAELYEDGSVDAKQTMYITDSEKLYQELRRQGKYVLPYRHERNQDAGFKGAPYVVEKAEELDYESVDMAYRRLAGLPWEILTTKRCIIRETIEEDVDSFYRIYEDPEITRYMENLYADRDEEIAYVKEYRQKVYAFYGYGMWTVLTREGTVIGRAGVTWREGFDIPEMGFVIGVPWQRQGYAWEICSAILDYAREELGFTQIQALVMNGNKKSAALCEKMGFECAGSAWLEEGEYILYRKEIGLAGN